jgi:uncharacterized protein
MSSTPLPKQVDVRKLIAADTTVTAREPLASFKRLCAMVEGSDGDVEVELHFFVDPQRLRRIEGAVQTTVQVICQICMKPLPVAIDSRFAVAAVWADDEAAHLPRDVDPYIVGDEPQDVRELVEDELIISLPYVSYHEPGQCSPPADFVNSAPEPEAPADAKENPFKVLEQLKSGK